MDDVVDDQKVKPVAPATVATAAADGSVRPACYDVVSLGEVLVDLVPLPENWEYTARAGGAPANMAAGLADRGHRVAMLGRVGADWYGDLVRETLKANGVATDLLQRDARRRTGLSVVARSGESPDFVLYRGDTADGWVEIDQAASHAIEAARLLHLGSLLSTSSAGEATLERAVALARANGLTVSADVNLRHGAWASSHVMLRHARSLIGLADIIKVTVDELAELGLALSDLTADGKLWLVTDAGRGAVVVHGAQFARRSAPTVTVVDTTGAGDASLAGLLDVVLRSGHRVGALPDEVLEAALAAAVAAGSAAVQRAGAM